MQLTPSRLTHRVIHVTKNNRALCYSDHMKRSPASQRSSLRQNVSLAIIIATSLIAATFIPVTAHAEQRYRVYKSTPFGVPEDSLNPSAIIEIDEFTGHGTVYEADRFGNADIFKGPKYIIESEFPMMGSIIDTDEPCDHDRHSRRHRRVRDLDIFADY